MKTTQSKPAVNRSSAVQTGNDRRPGVVPAPTATALSNSPRMIAQREMIHSTFGPAAATAQLATPAVVQRKLYKEGEEGAAHIPLLARFIAAAILKGDYSDHGRPKDLQKRRVIAIGEELYQWQDYSNLEGNLPKGSTYIKYDIHPLSQSEESSTEGAFEERGEERIIISSEGRTYFTANKFVDITEFSIT